MKGKYFYFNVPIANRKKNISTIYETMLYNDFTLLTGSRKNKLEIMHTDLMRFNEITKILDIKNKGHQSDYILPLESYSRSLYPWVSYFPSHFKWALTVHLLYSKNHQSQNKFLPHSFRFTICPFNLRQKN